jgi:hypothetical protein
MALIPRPTITRRKKLLTMADAVDRLLRVEEINPAETRAIERAIEAVRAAARAFLSHSTSGFRYYDSRDVVTYGGTIDLGTITVASNEVTCDNGFVDWPSWVALGSIYANNGSYRVTDSDVTSLYTTGLPDGSYTSAKLDQLFIQLPSSFRRRGSLSDNANSYPIVDVSPGILQGWQDYYEWARSSADPRAFAAVSGDQRFQGELMLMTWPPYTSDKSLHLFYERDMGELDVHRYGTGTVGITTTTVTASGSVFTDDHVGCAIVICTGNDTDIQNPLSSRDLVYTQRIITAVASGTSATIDESIGDPITTRTFFLSDVVDVQPGSQQEAFLRLCEYEFSRQSKSETATRKYAEFKEQIEIAMAEDARYKANADFGPHAEEWYGWGDVSAKPES